MTLSAVLWHIFISLAG